MKSICVFGLGWLGKQLVESFISQGIEVVGVNRSKKSDLPINQVVYDLNYPQEAALNQLKKYSFDLVIITVPPSSSKFYSTGVIHFLDSFNPNKTKVAYTSSTSVYGSKPRIIDEYSELDPMSKNAFEIVKIEEAILDTFQENALILRFSGLVGKKRHPISYLSGRTEVKQPYAVINLIHADEIIAFFQLIISNWNSGIYNFSNPDHPIKKEYYPWIAQQLNLKVPEFIESDKSFGKQIFSIRLKELNFEFKYQKLTEYPNPILD